MGLWDEVYRNLALHMLSHSGEVNRTLELYKMGRWDFVHKMLEPEHNYHLSSRYIHPELYFGYLKYLGKHHMMGHWDCFRRMLDYMMGRWDFVRRMLGLERNYHLS